MQVFVKDCRGTNEIGRTNCDKKIEKLKDGNIHLGQERQQNMCLNSVEHFKILTCNHEVGALIYERLSTCCAIVCSMHMYNIAR